MGEVHIDHDTGKLVIKVKMEGAKTAHQDLKTLSGGERSFITICFLLALGKQLQAMFHCLDEFDVFMDSISQGVRHSNRGHMQSGIAGLSGGMAACMRHVKALLTCTCMQPQTDRICNRAIICLQTNPHPCAEP